MSHDPTAPRQPTLLAPGEGRHYPMGRIGTVFKADGAESPCSYPVASRTISKIGAMFGPGY